MRRPVRLLAIRPDANVSVRVERAVRALCTVGRALFFVPTLTGTQAPQPTPMTMEQIAAGSLRRILGTTVIDKTGLTGLWDFAVAHSNQVSTTADAENRPTLDIALKEQLGLKLERGKGPVDVLVIDSVGALIED